MIKLKDIAEKADVTVSTVSAALNGTGRVSPSRRQDIIAVAEELGYRPNLAAKLLKSHETNLLGLVISDKISSFAGHGVYSGVMAEFLKECHDYDWRPHFEVFNYQTGDKIPAMFTDGLASGCLYCGYLSDEIRDWLKKHPEFPVVAFGEPWDYAVRSDTVQGISNAVQYLVATGHKNINVICGPSIYDVHNQTITGFKKAAEEFGIPHAGCIYEQTTLTGEIHNRENIGFLDQVMAKDNPPDALILSGVRLCSTTLYHLQHQGIKIPEDISIIGFLADWESTYLYPGITSIQRDISTMTSQALKMLSQRIKGKKIAEQTIWVEPKLVIKNTVKSRVNS